jgi:hypothetical protein
MGGMTPVQIIPDKLLGRFALLTLEAVNVL